MIKKIPITREKDRMQIRDTKKKINKEDLVVRLKLNRIVAQRGIFSFLFLFFCRLHNSCRGRIILLRPRNGCSTWRSFSFKLFSVRWRVLRNNPFIKVICEDCDQGKNKETYLPLCARLLHRHAGFDVFLSQPSFSRMFFELLPSTFSIPIYRTSKPPLFKT